MTIRRPPANVVIAFSGVLLFHLVSATSGRITVEDGYGWDGRAYASMVTDGLAGGSANTRTRPLIPLLARAPAAIGFGPLDAFVQLNYAFAFTLYLAASLILDRSGITTPARAVIVANLALCVASSKMFGFYPVQVDLGALALVTVAFYLAAAGRTAASGVACVLASAAREFGVAAALYGLHRSIRLGHSWRSAAAAYVPGLITPVVIRALVATDAAEPLSVADALANLRWWGSPSFVLFFAYFTATVFGGVSMLLLLRLRASTEVLKREPELATFLAVSVGLAVVGSLDIWRYLAFALPAALVLVAALLKGHSHGTLRPLLLATTAITVLTERPFVRMDETTYFRDWFPLYLGRVLEPAPDLALVWTTRAASVILLAVAARALMRQPPVRPAR